MEARNALRPKIASGVESHEMTQTPSPRRRRFAFTLVELLMVITIVGLLAALLFPAVTAAYRAALKYQCKNQLREAASGVLAYTTAFNGDIPPAKVTGSNQYWATIVARAGFFRVENTNLRDEDLMTDEPTVLICPETINLRVKESDRIQYPDDDLAQGWARMGNNQLMVDCSYYWNASADRGTPTIGEGPGFTPIAALVALLAAALFVYRRD